jgi:hypothetical protein
MWRPDYEARYFCEFGITEAIVGAVAAFAPEVAAATAADIGATAAITLPEVSVVAPAVAASAAPELAAGGALAGTGLGLGAATTLEGATGAEIGAGIDPTLSSALAPPSGGVVSPIGAATAPPVPLSAMPGAGSGIIGPPATGAVAPPVGVAGATGAPTPGSFSSIISGDPIGVNVTGVPPPGGSDLSSFTLTSGQDSAATNVANATATPGNAATGAGAPSAVSGSPDTSFVGSTFGGSSDATAGVTGASKASSFSEFAANPSLDTAGNILEKNPWAIGAGGIGMSLLRGNQALPGQSQIRSTANQLSTQGQQLQHYLDTGTLPPGVQAGITQATKAAEAGIRSKYAASGSSGSSAEMEDINNVRSLAGSQGASIALSLLNTGISESGLAAQLYQYLSANALSQDQALGTALASFGASLVPRTVTIQQAQA